MQKTLSLMNLIHSTTLKQEKDENQHEYFIHNKNETIKINYLVNFSIGHVSNTLLEKDFSQYIVNWINSGFKKEFYIHDPEIKKLLIKYGIEPKNFLGISNKLDELIKYKDKILNDYLTKKS